jgi:O-antigen/teichoic acid export membrane protein
LAQENRERTFRERFLGGAAWTGVTQAAAQAGQFFATAFLAHVLTPDDFGLVAFCFVVTGTVTVFREIGLPQAVVQLRELEAGHKNAAFWATTALSLLLAAAVFGGAGPLAGVLGDGRATPLLRVMSLSLLLNSLGLIPAALLTRAMDFKRVGVCDIYQVAANAVVALPLAASGYGVWSLAAGFLAGDAARTVATFYYARWVPGFRFSRAEVAALLRFGVGITGSSLGYSLRTYVDKFMVGRFLGVVALGGYNLAFRIMCVPQQRVAWLASRVTFAGFAAIQEDDARIGRIYLKTLKLTALVAAPALTVLAVCADDFVGLVYGPQWSFMVPALRIMCFAGICYAVGTTVGPVMMAKGRAGLFFALSLVLTGFLTAAVLIGLPFGLEGVAVGLAAQAAVGYSFGLYLVARVIKLRWGVLASAFRAPGAAAAAAGAGALAARALCLSLHPTPRLFATAAVGVAASLVALWLAKVPELRDLKNYAAEKFHVRGSARKMSAFRAAR